MEAAEEVTAIGSMEVDFPSRLRFFSDPMAAVGVRS